MESRPQFHVKTKRSYNERQIHIIYDVNIITVLNDVTEEESANDLTKGNTCLVKQNGGPLSANERLSLFSDIHIITPQAQSSRDRHVVPCL